MQGSSFSHGARAISLPSLLTRPPDFQVSTAGDDSEGWDDVTEGGQDGDGDTDEGDDSEGGHTDDGSEDAETNNQRVLGSSIIQL
jgi:hypothetical protein